MRRTRFVAVSAVSERLLLPAREDERAEALAGGCACACVHAAAQGEFSASYMGFAATGRLPDCQRGHSLASTG